MTWIRSIHDSSFRTGANLGIRHCFGPLGTGHENFGSYAGGAANQNAAQRNEQGSRSLSPNLFFPRSLCTRLCHSLPHHQPTAPNPSQTTAPSAHVQRAGPFVPTVQPSRRDCPLTHLPFSPSEVYGKPAPETPTLKHHYSGTCRISGLASGE